MTEILTVLAWNLGVLLLVFALAWAACTAMRDCTPVDALWAFGMVAIALATFVQTGGGTPRRAWLTGLCCVWGLRLGGYLLWRWRDHGPDRRYVRLMEKAKAEKGWDWGRASLQLVFLTQWPLLWITCLPVQLGQIAAEPVAIGPVGYAGIVLAIVGIVFETAADWHLTVFKKNPANAGKVLDTGLWRYTRHPNYFGDACLWWGLFLLGAETRPGLFAIIGPVFLTFTLIKWSGAPTLEHRMKKTRAGYADYITRTSGFIPWPPRKAA